MSTDKMNRRQMMKSLVAISVVSGFSPLTACQHNQLHPPLDGLDEDVVVMFGKQYLNRYPDDLEVETVKEILTQRNLSQEEMTQRFQEMMKSDFKNNRVVNLHGWFISKTEARIFAAAAEVI